ncbi:MAG: SRPBCC family protein [Cyanophyceae cyanobacterium]
MEETTNIHRNQPQSAGEAEQIASIIGGSALVLMELRQGSLRGALMSIAGGGLIYQGVTKKSTVKQAQEALGIPQEIKVEKTVTINRSPEELYSFWHNFENLPTFMKHLKSVTVLDERRSHWVANAPLDVNVEWDAQILQDEPNRLISWASLNDADIDNSGFVRFRPTTGNRGTEVKVVIEYNPPGGVLGGAIAKLFGESAEQQIGDELNRFKQLMEAREIATTEGQPHGS